MIKDDVLYREAGAVSESPQTQTLQTLRALDAQVWRYKTYFIREKDKIGGTEHVSTIKNDQEVRKRTK